MKAFAPIALALAASASACTFEFNSAYTYASRDWSCSFNIYADDNADPTKQSVQPPDDMSISFDCKSAPKCITGDYKGAKYNLCVNGGVGDDTYVGADITVQQGSGEVYSINADGKNHHDDGGPGLGTNYWRNNIPCPK